MNHYTVRFKVGKDKRVIETVMTLTDPANEVNIRRKVAAMGIESPRQFPPSAVKIVSVTELSV